MGNDAILRITDGTTYISLIDESSGFHLVNWVPAITDYKGGGVFQDPPLADWRQLRVAKWATAQENFDLTINGQNPNNVAYNLQELRRLLEKANAYWTSDWQSTPVYIEARAKCETNTRYCLVVKGRLGNDQNYYRQPFTGIRTTMRDLPLIIERRAWQNTVPGQGDDVAISASEDYDGRTYGVATATNAAETVVISGGKRIEANLTDVYRYDDSLATFSSNLLDAALPQNLLPSSTAVNDIIYFIIDTSLSNSGPFDNVVFDIGTAASSTGVYTGAWEYWNGAWTAFPLGDVQDNTAAVSNRPFSQTGVVTVSFEQKSDWTTTTINGITGYIVRMRVSALTGTFTIPTQQNRMIYSAIWPYIEVDSGQIPGDIPALSQIRLWPYGQQPGLSGFNYTPEIFVGLRSTSRGTNFTPYINIADEQNPTGITVSAISGTAAFANNIRSSTGRVIQYTPAGFANVAERVRITFSNALAPEYVGKFRCYLLFGVSTATFTFRLKVKSAFGTTVFTSDDISSNASATFPFIFTFIDFGALDLGAYAGVIKDSSESSSFIISIEIGADVAGTLNVPALLLMPVDEWSGRFTSDGNLLETFLGTRSFLFDSVEFPKRTARGLIHDSSELVVENMRSTINGPVILQANATQRYWFFVSDVTTLSEPGAATTYVIAAQINRTARYLSLRGNR